MSKVQLTLACWDCDRTRPLIDGRVRPAGIDLDIKVLRPREMFKRMLDDAEFDVSELSLAAYTALKARGDCRFAAIPAAPSRMFRHSCIYLRSEAAIKTPVNLKGKRVGATSYSSTAIVFMRGMLQHDYGVAPSDLRWFIGRLNDAPELNTSVEPLIALNLPKDIELQSIRDDDTLEGLLAAGKLDAIFSINIPAMFQNGLPGIARLFPDFREVEQDYYRRTRIFPIMHTVVIREHVHRKHRWVAQSLYNAFCDAKDMAIRDLYDTDALRLALPWLIDHVEEARRELGSDFWAYGLDANRPALTAVGQYVYEQGLAPRPIEPDELFLPMHDGRSCLKQLQVAQLKSDGQPCSVRSTGRCL
jgi:4,5-dihydroxyphthalate decarboxylase